MSRCEGDYALDRDGGGRAGALGRGRTAVSDRLK